MSDALRNIPSVDKVLRDLGDTGLPRPAVVAVVRRELAVLRAAVDATDSQQQTTDIFAHIRAALDALRRSRLQPVINGTGIIVHTNFGRSPLGPEVVRAIADVAADYNNLEYDLPAGRRGGRAAYLEHNLAVLCQSEAAAVVNNCAAALVLVLRRFAAKPPRTEVVISRGELVQIGGGFRIPEILEAAGATLREVGTTNKTTADDYARAVNDRTALVLKVHRSNFYLGGFTETPPADAVAAAARAAGVPFVEDLGGGAVAPTENLGGAAGEHEPTPAEVLRRGADLVCFSGDKLLGGPQAGVVAGKASHIAALKKEPFFRALRCDKLVLAALQATVDLHLRRAGGAGDDPPGGRPSGIPILDMMYAPPDALRPRVERLVAGLVGLAVGASVGTGEAQVGGGSLPRTVIPSVTLDLIPRGVGLDDFAARLRAGTPPVVGYVSGGRFKLDLRTIFPRQDDQVLAAVRAAAG